MFELLRYRWTLKQVGLSAITTFLLALFALLYFIKAGALSTGQVMQGVVHTVYPVSVAGVCGGSREVAGVQLPDGQVVMALVGVVGNVHPGAKVTLRHQTFACNPTSYEVVNSEYSQNKLLFKRAR